MHAADLRKKKMEDLEKQAVKLQEDIDEAYFEMRTGNQQDVRKPREMRKELATLKTVIREMKLDKLSKQGTDGR